MRKLSVAINENDIEVLVNGKYSHNIMNFKETSLEECFELKKQMEDYFKRNKELTEKGVMYITQMEYANCLNRIVELQRQWVSDPLKNFKLGPPGTKGPIGSNEE